MNAWIKKILIGAVVLIALYFVVNLLLLKPVRQFNDEGTDVQTAKVETGDIIDRLKLRGKIVATRNVPVFPLSSGQVVRIHAEEGDFVEEGDLLLDLEQTQLKDTIDTQRMNMKKTQITLDNVQQEFQRKQALFDEKFIAELEFIEAKKMLDLAEVDYKLAKKELDALEKQVGITAVIAPISGVVTKANAEDGEVLTTQSQDAEGKLLFMITDLENKGIELRVSEVERAHLERNQIVEFWLATDPTKRHKGKVIKIAAGATESDGMSSRANQFTVQVEILDGGAEMNLGASANVEIIVQEARGALRVPIEAVFRDDEESFVYLEKRKGYEKQAVTTGISSVNHIEIRSGLKEKDVVALEEPIL